MKKSKGFIGGVVIGLIILIAVITCITCIEKVPTGYVGVVYEINKGVTGEIVTQGFHFLPPTKKITIYSIGIEQSYLTSEDKGDSPKDESFNIPTADGKTVKVSLEFSYRFDVDRVTDTFTKFKGRSGENIKNTFIKPKMQAWTQEVGARYPVTDIFGDKRTEINEALDVYLKQKFDPYGIIIDTVNFTDISVDESTGQAIQQKVNAQQELELARIEKQTAEVQANKDKQVALIQAEQNKETAAIEAEQAKIKAEGQAEAMRIKAEAEAAANKMIAESLTPELIENSKINKWDGKVPMIQGSSSGLLINSSDIFTEE